MKLGLENVSRLFAELGDPQKSYLKVQVAGTNGKGSVCAFLNSICVTAGIRTGMYTSPHLISITERIQIDGVEIGEEEFARLATVVRAASETLVTRGELETVPTFFEQVTAIALVAFAEAKVELAILETGLGGRLDATTAANAEIAAITRIDIDHQQYLGDTIEEIAAEKAAIIHQGSTVIFLRQDPVVNHLIRNRCHEFGIIPRPFIEEVRFKLSDGVVRHLEATFRTKIAVYEDIVLGLPGEHQIENASVAIGIAEALMDVGLGIWAEAIKRGLTTARHPGRLERIGRFLLDGAHNPGGARALRRYLEEFVRTAVTMVFGAMSDKNVGEMIAILFPAANPIVLTEPANPRAIEVEDIAKLIPEELRYRPRFHTSNAREAIEKSIEVAWEEDLILVTGSLYLVGEVRKILTPEISDK